MRSRFKPRHTGGVGQSHKEGGALSFPGLEPDAPMVPLDEFAAEIKSQPRPADPVAFGIACTRKLTEDARLVLFGDAYSPVTDAHAGLLCITRFRESHLDWPALWTVLDGIADQVGEHLSPGAAERYAVVMERYEQLVEEERSRIAVRHQWLEQKQAWLEAREQAPDPQHEWLAEQRAWLEQQ